MDIYLLEKNNDFKQVINVLAQLRSHYHHDTLSQQIERQQLSGYQVAYVKLSGAILAAAGFRISENLAWGRHLYVDDLVTNSECRSQGVGHILIDWLQSYALNNDCQQMHLDSGVQRFAAHKFYLREGFNIASHHFSKVY